MEHQSRIRYLETEADIARAAGHPIPVALRPFDLEGIRVHRHRLIRQLAPSFERLSWDEYDVKREQVAFLADRFPTERAWLDGFLRHYWIGDASVSELEPLVRQLLPGDQILFGRIRSYRRRAIAQFVVTNKHEGNWEKQWRVVDRECHGFGQDVASTDIRSLRREVDPAALTVVHHPDFEVLILAMAEMVEDAETEASRGVEEMTITFHQMGLVAHPDRVVGNSPEGIHQDGSDYIVSALVVGRENVEGGESQIFLGQDGPTVYRRTLLPGQGIFMADQGGPLWHQVTPVRVIDSSHRAVRNIFGFDAKLSR